MKDTVVSARVETEIKNEAENILRQLGVPVSVVINSLYRQIIYKHGIPFPLTVPPELPTRDSLSDEEFKAIICERTAEIDRGEGIPVEDAIDIIRGSV